MKLSPASYIIHVFGGVRAAARAIGYDHSTISRWPKPRFEKGTNGLVPQEAQQKFLKAAKRLNLDLNPADLVVGREVPLEALQKQKQK
jgi:hypothetical protein